MLEISKHKRQIITVHKFTDHVLCAETLLVTCLWISTAELPCMLQMQIITITIKLL